jgi:hypothetical protein
LQILMLIASLFILKQNNKNVQVQTPMSAPSSRARHVVSLHNNYCTEILAVAILDMKSVDPGFNAAM